MTSADASVAGQQDPKRTAPDPEWSAAAERDIATFLDWRIHDQPPRATPDAAYPTMTGLGSQHAPEPFKVELEPHRETLVVAAHGEIDIVTAGQLQQQLRELVNAGFKRLVLDLRQVSFIDSTGLRTVIDINAASGRAGVEFAMFRGSEPVQRLFELTQTDEAFRFIDPADVESPWP